MGQSNFSDEFKRDAVALRDLMAMEEVQQVLADLAAREVINEGQTFVFHGLRKNACCNLLELGLSDTQVGSMLGMSPKMVRHYGKRARALMTAKSAADFVKGGRVVSLGVAQPTGARQKSARFQRGDPNGHDPRVRRRPT